MIEQIERAAHLIGLELERQLGNRAVTQAEAHILARLARAGAATPGELHRLFGHKRSTLTSVLDRLERRGYATRAIHPDDRRTFLVSLTPEGEVAAAAVVRALEALEARVAQHISEDDLAICVRVLTSFADTVLAPGT